MNKKSGILLINKPIKMSSFFAVKKIRSLLGIKKVGHAGTLDPLAQGLLVIAFGKYTKLCEYLSGESKIYQTVIKLGEKTTTDDAEGEVLETKDCSLISKNDIEEAIKKFTGIIAQVPPNFSAIKINGKRAYAMARNNENILLQPRNIEIYYIKLISFNLPYITLEVFCSKGTYIRSLARDLGDYLGCNAYAYNITRLSSGSFNLNDAALFDDLTKENIYSYVLFDSDLTNNFSTLKITQEDWDNKNLLPNNLQQFCLVEVNNKIVAFIKQSLEQAKIVNLLD